MKMKETLRDVWAVSIVLTVVSILLLFICVATAISGPPKELPSIIGLSTFGQGSKPYIVMTAIAHAVERQSGIKVRVIPAVNDKARMMTVLRGEALAGYFGIGSFAVAGGILEWLKEGPQDISILWAGAPAVVTTVVRGDSGIKTWADIKGKRVADCRRTSPVSAFMSEGNLAFGGLTFNDVISVPLSPYAPSTKALIEGAVDVSFDGTATPTVYELESSAHGVYIFETPPENVEGWKRVNKVCPLIRPYAYTWGVGASKTKPKWWPSTTLQFVCRPDADAELVYTVAKSIHRGYDLFKDAHGECPLWNIDIALDLNVLGGLFVPYHPGVIRYFKEIGRWNSELEKWQQSRIELGRKVRRSHLETKDEAVKKGIVLGSVDFENLWKPKWFQLTQRIEMGR